MNVNKIKKHPNENSGAKYPIQLYSTYSRVSLGNIPQAIKLHKGLECPIFLFNLKKIARAIEERELTSLGLSLSQRHFWSIKPVHHSWKNDRSLHTSGLYPGSHCLYFHYLTVCQTCPQPSSMVKGQRSPKLRYWHIIFNKLDTEISKSIFLSDGTCHSSFMLLFKGLQAVWTVQLYNLSIFKTIEIIQSWFYYFFKHHSLQEV